MTENNETATESKLRSIGQWLKTVFGCKGAPDTTRELEHEIQELLEEGEEQGLITSQQEQMISSIFDFRDTMASEIMTPSVEMISADVHSSTAELVRLITEEGFTRIPVFSKNQDNIIGVLHAKDLLRICSLPPGQSIGLRDVLNPPMIIPESMQITHLLRDFQAKKKHMAIVIDEFGSVRGLVTLEDVVEEIVGEISDEHDQEERELTVVDEQTIVVDAKIEIEEVEEYFHIKLPEGPYESAGGIVVHRLGRVPEAGDTIEIGPLTFTVLTADARRICSLRIRK